MQSGREILGRWGTFIFVPQLVVGWLAYEFVAYHYGDVDALKTALSAAGVATVICTLIAMFYDDHFGIAVGLSSLAAVLTLLGINAAAPVFAIGVGFVSMVLAVLAANLVRCCGQQTNNENFFIVVLSALPVVGALLYLFERWKKEGREART